MNIYTDEVTRRFGEQEPTKQDHKRILKDIHSYTLYKNSLQIARQDYNPPPSSSPDEIKLTRIARSRLKQTQPAFPLPAYGPPLLKPLISLDWKKSKILTQTEATTTTT